MAKANRQVTGGSNLSGSEGTARGLIGHVMLPGAHAQFVRWAAVGVSVGAMYLGLTLLLAGPVGLPIQAAIPIGYTTAIALHFSLQRWFVFHSPAAFALAMHHQVGRYVLLAVMQYGIVAVSTGVLPRLIDVPERVVYVGTVCVSSAIGFVLLRTSIFHPPSE